MRFQDKLYDESESSPLKELDVFEDRIVVFEAVLKSSPSSDRQATRSPLQPTNRQMSQDNASLTEAVMRQALSITNEEKDSHFSPDLKRSSSRPSQDENVPLSTSRSHRPGPELPARSANNVEPGSQGQNSPSNFVITPPEAADRRIKAAVPLSHHVYDPYLNKPFLVYLDQYNEANHGALGDFSPQYVFDMAWDSWQSLPIERRRVYVKLGTRGLEDTMTGDQLHKACLNQKPVLAENAGFEEEESQDIKPDIDFKDQFRDAETTQSQPIATIPQVSSFQLQDLTTNVTLEILETSVEKGAEYLDELKRPLEEKVSISPDAAQWLRQIETLQKQATKTKTIIGVVGNTGAGKSSVINAMLDEERLV